MTERGRVLAIVSVLAPVLLLTGIADEAHEVLWRLWYGDPAAAPVRLLGFAAWLVVWGLGLLGLRRSAVVAAGIACAGFLAALVPQYSLIPGPDAAVVLLVLLATAAVLGSPGPRYGLGLIGRRAPVVVAALVLVVIFARVLGHHYAPVADAAWLALAVVTALACRPGTRTGRYAVVLLAVPALAGVLAESVGDRLFGQVPAQLAICYALPLLLGACAWPLLRRPADNAPAATDTGPAATDSGPADNGPANSGPADDGPAAPEGDQAVRS